MSGSVHCALQHAGLGCSLHLTQSDELVPRTLRHAFVRLDGHITSNEYNSRHNISPNMSQAWHMGLDYQIRLYETMRQIRGSCMSFERYKPLQTGVVGGPMETVCRTLASTTCRLLVD